LFYYSTVRNVPDLIAPDTVDALTAWVREPELGLDHESNGSSRPDQATLFDLVTPSGTVQLDTVFDNNCIKMVLTLNDCRVQSQCVTGWADGDGNEDDALSSGWHKVDLLFSWRGRSASAMVDGERVVSVEGCEDTLPASLNQSIDSVLLVGGGLVPCEEGRLGRHHDDDDQRDGATRSSSESSSSPALPEPELTSPAASSQHEVATEEWSAQDTSTDNKSSVKVKAPTATRSGGRQQQQCQCVGNAWHGDLAEVSWSHDVPRTVVLPLFPPFLYSCSL
jgi:hypothetical protein